LLKPFIHLLLHPLVLALLLGLGAWFAHRGHWPLLGQFLWFLSGLWLFLCIFTSLPHRLLHDLERRYPPLLSVPAEASRILVLASGFTNDTALPAQAQLGSTMLQRVSEGLRVKHLRPDLPLVCSGPRGQAPISQARMAAQAAIDLGCAPEDTLLLENAHHTLEELRHYAARFPPEEPFVLVSSARHLPRACSIAQTLGLRPIPSPTDYQVKQAPQDKGFLSPGFAGIRHMRQYLHETVGRLYAWVSLGRDQT